MRLVALDAPLKVAVPPLTETALSVAAVLKVVVPDVKLSAPVLTNPFAPVLVIVVPPVKATALAPLSNVPLPALTLAPSDRFVAATVRLASCAAPAPEKSIAPLMATLWFASTRFFALMLPDASGTPTVVVPVSVFEPIRSALAGLVTDRVPSSAVVRLRPPAPPMLMAREALKGRRVMSPPPAVVARLSTRSSAL